MREAQLRAITRDRINKERQRVQAAQLERYRQLQATIDAYERDLREHRARQIEEFRRTNGELMRAMLAMRRLVHGA